MREFFKNLALFAIFCVVLSSFSGCTGTTATSGGNNKAPDPPRVGGDPSKPSIYPPLPAGLASAEMEMLDGTKVKIGDKKGKALVLNLWALWCGFCREEMPHLDKWQKQYGNDRLEIISLDIGDQSTGAPEPLDQIKKYLADNKIDYTTGRIGGDSLRQFYLLAKQTAIPQTIMADADGHLRGVFVGGGQKNIDSMKQTIDKMMAE